MGKVEKIKLKNFKSFKKVDLPIASGYTVIIGPNGSGKSNIIDGLCFAIGTSSMRNLRADRLTDLIAEGSKDGTSSVDVDFRDDGGEKYVISRTIDKKGQSVFRMNSRRTTRFQINELLRKMNITPDGHNIIMQGEVNRFIKMTPQQRRGYIDEVSGIAEYEMKKTESIKELDRVETKLKEATIVLGEKEGYLRTLEKEKVEAEVYVKLRDELKGYEATLVKKELDSVEKSFTKSMEFIAKAKLDLEDLEKKKGEKRKKADGLNDEIEKIGKKIFEESDRRQLGVRQEIEEVKENIARLEQKISFSKELIEKNQNKQEVLNKEISQIGNEIKKKEKEVEQLSPEEDNLLKKQHELQREYEKFMKEIGAKVNVESSLKKVEDLNTKIDEKKEKIYAFESKISSLEERVSLKKANLQAKTDELKTVEGKGIDTEKRLKDYKEKKKKLEKKINEIKKEIEDLFEKEKEANETLQQIETNLQGGQKELRRLSERVAVLKKEGVLNNAAKEVLKSKQLTGIMGTVGDLVSYEPKYARAIEAAAGNRMFFIVTRSSLDATEAVKFLKKNKFGRATFIPLDRIKPKKKSKESIEALDKKGAIKHVIDLVKFKGELEPVFEFVFGDTVAVESIDDAREIGIGSVRMATLDGDIAEASGLVRGGFSKESVSSNDLKMLNKLEKSVDNLERDKRRVMVNLETTRGKINNLRDERNKVELDLKETDVMINEWQSRLSEFEKGIKSGTLKDLEKEVKAIELEVDEKRRLVEKFKSELDKLLEEKIKMKSELGSVVVEQPSEIEEIQSKIQKVKDDLSDLKVKRSALLSEIEGVFIKNQKSLKKQIKVLEKENELMDEGIKKIGNERNNFFNVLKEKEEKARELATSMKDLYREKEKMEKEQRGIFNKIGELNREIDVLKEKKTEKEIDKAKVEERYKDLKKSWEKLKDCEINEKMSFKDLNEKVEVLTRQIETIGNVNMKAIEMYEEYYKDIGEIIEKKKTLTEEREHIISMIDEIDKKKYEVFMEAFNALSKYFHEYFIELYHEKGSKASIELENIENPLEGGLLLKAAPAGKQVKVIDLLSGGEKTLTAIAFIFAIQRYNPSPFYVLDEVDAALDSDNSTRVAQMLKKASKDIQMIIVTHNKHVLQNADQIIGVHKGKDGSSVVEVDMSEYAAEKLEIAKGDRGL